MANFTVVYDAWLFYQAPLRDLMVRLAQTRRFRARWTRQVQDEWVEALLRKEPRRDRAKLVRTVELMKMGSPLSRTMLTQRSWHEFQASVPNNDNVNVIWASSAGQRAFYAQCVGN